GARDLDVSDRQHARPLWRRRRARRLHGTRHVGKRPRHVRRGLWRGCRRVRDRRAAHGTMNTLRGLIAVVGGLTITRLIVQPLEITLVNALAPQPPQSAADVAAVLNAPLMMAARVVYTGVGAILGGYLTARIAGHDPMRYTII